MSTDRVRDAYQRRAQEYIERLGSLEATAAVDRALVTSWAGGLSGRVLDVGAGPGHWTALLHETGLDVEGVDPVPDFVDHARRRYPGVTFRRGRAEHLEVPDGGLGGVLAWYSLIHAAPDRLEVTLAELARVLRPGGGLLIGFFEGADLAPFDHAVTTAYAWPVDRLAVVVERAGFTVTGTHTRTEPGARRHGDLAAVRTGG